jgi:hypothetical protein
MTNQWTERGGWWVAGQSVLMAGNVIASLFWRDQWYSGWTFGLGLGLFVAGGTWAGTGPLFRDHWPRASWWILEFTAWCGIPCMRV